MSVANNNEIVQAYISNFRTFEESLNGSRDMPFHELRRQAIACFSKLGFPTPRSEEWKYTNVAPILARQFGATQTDLAVTAAEVEELTFKGLTENVIVFVNGRFAESLSRIKITAKGIIIKAQEHRTQQRNRQAAIARLQDIVRAALVEPKKRVATKPSLGVKRRRITDKRRKGQLKQTRRPVSDDS